VDTFQNGREGGCERKDRFSRIKKKKGRGTLQMRKTVKREKKLGEI
jgi:hypothetical protein